MCPAMSTVPRLMTACGFPTANGVGFPVGSAVTVRWTISSRSTAIPFWRPWKPSPEGLPSRRLPLVRNMSWTAQKRPAPKEEKPKHLLLPQAAPDNRAMMAYLKGRGIDQEILDYCVQTGRIYESRNKGHSNVVFVGFDKDGKHAFDKSYSSYGVPYVQENCDIGISDNLVLYGHHMNNGSMFSDLCKYESEDFYREHKIIHFDTLESFGEYEVIAAFKTVAYSQEGFKYYHFVRAESAEQFDEYIAGCKELALYDTGVTAEYGDKLITLSTCEYSRTNGRMVVVAKLLEE